MANAGSAARLVFLGDSITEGWLRTGLSASSPSVMQPACERIWTDSFAEWRPLNFGIGGDRVQDVGWRLQHGGLPPSLQPEVFVVLVGTNDIGNGEAAATVVLSELEALLRQLHRARPRARVLAHGLLPRGADHGEPRTPSFHRSGWWDARWNRHAASAGAINAGLKALADGRPWLTYVDCGNRFVDAAEAPSEQALPPAERKGGAAYIRPELMYDLLHLTPRGYAAWAACLRPQIAAAMKAS